MTSKSPTPDNHRDERTTIRRKDRDVHNDAWIRAFLDRAAYATWATALENQPFINTNTFIYDADRHAIYMHSGREGRTHRNVLANDRVCLSVSEMGRLLPADRAIAFSVEYASIVVFGRAKIVSNDAEARAALQGLLDKYFGHLKPGTDYVAITAEEIRLTCVYRIDIDTWSAKRNEKPADFPGAFMFGKHPRPAT